MGLDQYAYAVMPHKDNTDFKVGWEGGEAAEIGAVKELAYWRKHPNLQGWMEQLWLRKREEAGDPAQPETEGFFAGTISFNCCPIRLTMQDLIALRDAINEFDLPPTSGFFFGEDSDLHYKELDLQFVENALQAIGQDMEVYYDSWW